MPLVRFDLIEGRTPKQVNDLLGAAHRALVKAFDVPERDRYQIVHEHRHGHLIVQDTGLGITRTDDVVVVSIISRPRSESSKLAFYQLLCEELQASCGIASSDVVVSVVINSDEDWSFGYGKAQFITGDL